MDIVVYYSKRDDNSRAFVTQLKKHKGMAAKSSFVDVDSAAPGSSPLPDYVRAVPTVVLSAQRRVLVGSKAFEWLEQQQQQQQNGAGECEVQCYDQGGMGGCNVLCFAFLDGDGAVCSQQSFGDLTDGDLTAQK